MTAQLRDFDNDTPYERVILKKKNGPQIKIPPEFEIDDLEYSYEDFFLTMRTLNHDRLFR